MSNQPLFQLDTPIPAASEDRRVRKLANLRRMQATQARDILARQDFEHRKALNSIWGDPDITIEEAFEALGTDAARLVDGSRDMTIFLMTQYAKAGIPYDPPTFPPGITLVPNADGSITVVRE